jgi:putative transposase
VLLFSMWYWLQCIFYLWSCRPFRQVTHYHPRTKPIDNHLVDYTASTGCQHRKPGWVVEKLIHISATHPGWGCRKIAAFFNKRFDDLSISVSKSFVSNTVKRHRVEIQRQRKQWRLRAPFAYPLHAVWGLDLTTILWANEKALCLGVIDHGSRQALGLTTLPNKCSITILRVLLDLVERYGIPHCLRTDNEAVFTSYPFRFFLQCLGIRHQRTAPGCPWQNGRIERLFGTLKQTLSQWAPPTTLYLQSVLSTFQHYYNTYRPHQALNGKTPFQAAQQLATKLFIKKQKRRR